MKLLMEVMTGARIFMRFFGGFYEFIISLKYAFGCIYQFEAFKNIEIGNIALKSSKIIFLWATFRAKL